MRGVISLVVILISQSWSQTTVYAWSSGTPSGSRFLIINCENIPSWIPSFDQMFCAKLKKPGDIWNVCQAALGEELPLDAALYDGIVLTGSHFDCLSERGSNYFAWYNPIIDLIREAAKVGYPRMYGSCFGANMLVFSLNGVVSRNPNNRYIVQAERLMMYDEFRHMMSAYPSLPSSSISASYQVLCTHEHHCSSLPNESVLLGSTPLCRNHAFVLGRHRNLLGIQSHPEFDLQYCILDQIWPNVVGKLHRLSPEQMQESLTSFEGYTDEDANGLCEVISAFLRGGGGGGGHLMQGEGG